MSLLASLVRAYDRLPDAPPYGFSTEKIGFCVLLNRDGSVATLAFAGGDVVELASMAKLKGGRLSREIADWAVQFYGGMGYTWDNPASRAFRDARLASIGGGADEVMMQVIAKKMGLMSNASSTR